MSEEAASGEVWRGWGHMEGGGGMGEVAPQGDAPSLGAAVGMWGAGVSSTVLMRCWGAARWDGLHPKDPES